MLNILVFLLITQRIIIWSIFNFILNISEDNDNTPCDFNLLKKDIETFKKKLLGKSIIELESGSVHKGKIISIKDYGIIVSIENCDQVGLLHVSKLKEDFDEIYSLGDEFEIKILEYKPMHNKYNLCLVEK